MQLQIRKIHQVLEEIHYEGGRKLDKPLRLAAVAAIVKNPYAGEYVKDLTELGAAGLELGPRLSRQVVAALGGPDQVEAFGKGVIVGIGGELEHGSVLIHGKEIGDTLREASAGDAPIPSAEKVDATGCAIDIPLKTKAGKYQRKHHQNFTVRVPDAPMPDEIMVVLAVSSGGRPHARQ
ncbi:amino acid synthesis family protein [Ramlibacter sp. AN1015]|uniref:amino acid synthesis family protein n=1 Tax=Ramlibacter sp. AN1015 TaxID=3133428 RepID=UPI0030BFB515